MHLRSFKHALAVVANAMSSELIVAVQPRLEVWQLTNGPQHHFFG